jgi:hypothetical protein
MQEATFALKEPKSKEPTLICLPHLYNGLKFNYSAGLGDQT